MSSSNNVSCSVTYWPLWYNYEQVGFICLNVKITITWDLITVASNYWTRGRFGLGVVITIVSQELMPWRLRILRHLLDLLETGYLLFFEVLTAQQCSHDLRWGPPTVGLCLLSFTHLRAFLLRGQADQAECGC
jgi:hypothetical protein